MITMSDAQRHAELNKRLAKLAQASIPDRYGSSGLEVRWHHSGLNSEQGQWVLRIAVGKQGSRRKWEEKRAASLLEAVEWAERYVKAKA